MNNISFWVNQCHSFSPYSLLRNYGYEHDFIKFGDLGGARIRVSRRYFELDNTGTAMIVQGVWADPPSLSNPVENLILPDIIAWHPKNPCKWHYLRGETGLVLGEKYLFYASAYGDPLYIYETPFEWLKAEMKGVVLLDFNSLHRLLGIKQVVFTNPQYAQKIKRSLTAIIYKGFPKFGVDTHLKKGQRNAY